MLRRTSVAFVVSSLALASCSGEETADQEIERISAATIERMTPQINSWAGSEEVPQLGLLGIKMFVSLGCAERIVKLQQDRILTAPEREAERSRERNCDAEVTKRVMNVVNSAVFGTSKPVGEQDAAEAPTTLPTPLPPQNLSVRGQPSSSTAEDRGDSISGDASSDAPVPAEVSAKRDFTPIQQIWIERVAASESTCRGGSGPESEEACGMRTEATRNMNNVGVCWGKKDESYADYDYHFCGPNSL